MQYVLSRDMVKLKNSEKKYFLKNIQSRVREKFEIKKKGERQEPEKRKKINQKNPSKSSNMRKKSKEDITKNMQNK